jgi:multisubunit Na+/H+ antiporter MnhG subunit
MAVAKENFTSFLNLCVQLTVHLSDMLLESGMFYTITGSVSQSMLGNAANRANIPRTLHSSVSSCTCRGSKLSRRVPSNMAGS